MNKKIIIGNFKMNLLPNEVVLYIENLKKDIKSNNEIVLCEIGRASCRERV